MKILTKYPVYVNKKQIASGDFSNMSDTLPTDAFSYLDYSNGDGDAKTAAITAGIGAAAGVGTALLNRQKAPLTEVEMKCGKMPKVGKKRKQEWRNCASNVQPTIDASASRLAPPTFVPSVIPPPEPPKSNKNLIIGVSVVAVLVVAGYLLYKNTGTKTATK